MTRIKICGLRRPEDIEIANRLKPEYVGFVFAPSRRQVTAEQAGVLRKMLGKDICPVGVFVDETEEKICEIVRLGIVDAVQLHGHETVEEANRLKRALAPLGTAVIKAVRMKEGSDLSGWEDSDVDYLLLDSGTGTGKTFDHGLIGEIRKPWFLAGGMNPDNAAGAVRRFHPYGIDVSSGVETDGWKDSAKVERMIRNVRGADR